MILIGQKKEEAEAITKAQAKIKASLEAAKHKLGLLNDYQGECMNTTNRAPEGNALNSQYFRNQFMFSEKIQDAINQQTLEISTIEKNIEEKNAQYLKILLEIRKFEAVIERKKALQEKKLNKIEQKQNDEYAARMTLRASRKS